MGIKDQDQFSDLVLMWVFHITDLDHWLGSDLDLFSDLDHSIIFNLQGVPSAP